MATLTPSVVRTQIASGAADPIYLLQGEDDVEKSALAGELADLVEEGLRAFNVERIHAGEMTTGDKLADGVASLVAAVRTLPMMAPRRVVIVMQAETLLVPRRESEAAARALEELETLLEHPEPQATLVFVAAPLDKRVRIWKLLQKHATIVECGVIEDLAAAQQWVRARVAKDGVEIERADAELGVGKVMQIADGPALSLEDDRASEAQHAFRDDAVSVARAAFAAAAALVSRLRDCRAGCHHEHPDERQISNDRCHIPPIAEILTPPREDRWASWSTLTGRGGVSPRIYYRAAPLAPQRGCRVGGPALSRPENRGRRLVVTSTASADTVQQ